MIKFYDITREKIKKTHPNWPIFLIIISNHPYRIVIIEGSRSGKTLLNLISHQTDIDKIYIYAKDPFEAKYQLLITNAKIEA